MHGSETFQTPWLRYLNCKKVDIFEIYNSILVLSNLIKDIIDKELYNTELSANIIEDNATMNFPLDAVFYSSINIDDSVLHSLRQIKFLQLNNVTSGSNTNKNTIESTIKTLEQLLQASTDSVCKQTQADNPLFPQEDLIETQRTEKNFSVCKSGSIKTVRYEEYRKLVISRKASRNRHLNQNPGNIASDVPSNSLESSSSFSSLEQDLSSAESYSSTANKDNAVQEKQLSPKRISCLPISNQSSSEKSCSVSSVSPNTESGIFSINKEILRPLSTDNLPHVLHTNESSRSSKCFSSNSQEISQSIIGYSELNHPEPLPENIDQTSPSTPIILENSGSISSSSSTLRIQRKCKPTKNLSILNETSLVSLFPKKLREHIGKSIIKTNDIYLIIIEKPVHLIIGLDREVGILKIFSKIGCEFNQVRRHYADHLMYYNTFFPFLLLECFCKISTALKEEKDKMFKNFYKISHFITKQHYVHFECTSFIPQSDYETIPKDGHVVLVQFSAVPTGSFKMLGYVSSCATRPYSHKSDHDHEILKYMNVKKPEELVKIKVTFRIVYDTAGINLDLPIHISNLTNIKTTLILNEALKEITNSPLCESVLRPWKNNIKKISLPRRQDLNAVTTVVDEIVQSLISSSFQLTVVESTPSTDPILVILQVVDKIKRSSMPGKTLVCVRAEFLSEMGMNLFETSCSFVIIIKKKGNLHGQLEKRVLNTMVSNLSKIENISNNEAKSRILKDADVLLAATETCFYENVKNMATDLKYCLINDSHSFTELESLIPLLYGIEHLFLFGDPDESCHLNSKGAANLGYNKSLFHRAYNLC